MPTIDFSIQTKEGDDTLRARFSVSPGAGRYVDGNFAVYPNSLLFRSGEYADKKFSMTPEELNAAAENWVRLGGNIQHTDFLKGEAAFIDRTWTEQESDDTTVLRGMVRVPLGLDELLRKEDKHISLEWNRAGKFAEGFALCTNPRIPDAALMSAVNPKEKSPMANFFDDLKALFTKNGVVIPGEAAPANQDRSQERPAENEELKKLRQRVIEQDAATFAEAEFTAGRCTPAQKPGLIGEYVQAATDDALLPSQVSFSVAGEQKKGTRVEALIARQSGRHAIDYTHEMMADIPEDAHVLGEEPAEFAASNGRSKKPVLDPTTIYGRRAKAIAQSQR